jgi:predicted MFS family arabinose efflux permease
MAAETKGNDWFAVAAYALVAATSQLLWLTYAPLTTEAARHFGVSESAVGWLAEIFPLLYVLLAIPAGILLDRWLRPTLLAAAGLMLAGAAIRMADNFSAALAGQLLIAVAQPAVLAAMTKLAAERVASASRTTAISIGSAGMFLGILAALVLGATIGSSGGFRPLLLINLAVALAAFALAAIALRRPAAHEAEEQFAVGLRELRAIYTDPVFARLGTMIFLGMGVFNGLATWLEVLLHPAGVSSSTAGWMLVALSVCGIAGTLILPPRVAARGQERGYLQLAAVAGAVAMGVMAVSGVLPLQFAVLGALGFFLFGAQPVILEISERRAGHAAASAAGAIFLAGNLGGIVIAVGVQAVHKQPTLAFMLLALAMFLMAPLARSLRPGFNEPAVGNGAAAER